MASTDKIIVIGGGLAGVTTLYELARRGRDVTLLDGQPALANVTSHANGGLLTASMSDPWNGPGVAKHLAKSIFDPGAAMKLRPGAMPGLASWGLTFLRNSTRSRHAAATRSSYALARESVRATLALSAALGLTFDQSAAGTLKVFGSRAASDGPKALTDMLGQMGLRARVLSGSEAIAMEPQLEGARDKIACALHYPDDAAGDACTFTQALARQAQALGGEVRLDSQAERILVEAGRVIGVEVRGERMDAAHVVVAAGCASPVLTASLGVRLPIKPAKGYTVTVDMSHLASKPRMPIIDDAMHAALTPLGDRLRIAGTAEFTGHDLRLDPGRIDNLFRLFERMYPQLARQVDRRQARAWTGLRPMSADGLPFIGAAGPQGLWVNSGHGHLGWTMAVGSAALLAAQMQGETPAVDPTPYRVRR